MKLDNLNQATFTPIDSESLLYVCGGGAMATEKGTFRDFDYTKDERHYDDKTGAYAITTFYLADGTSRDLVEPPIYA